MLQGFLRVGTTTLAVLALLIGAGCAASSPLARTSTAGATSAPAAPRPSSSSSTQAASQRAALEDRLAQIADAVRLWQTARDLPEARRAAERARNLIVGAAGPYYGDADGDGTLQGASERGLLPGLRGEPGIAGSEDGACVVRDILGGAWSDPAARWAELDARIREWAPARNTFPTLASHPQRIVGWATLALRAGSVAEAVEYSAHARLHSDISQQALTDCVP